MHRQIDHDRYRKLDFVGVGRAFCQRANAVAAWNWSLRPATRIAGTVEQWLIFIKTIWPECPARVSSKGGALVASGTDANVFTGAHKFKRRSSLSFGKTLPGTDAGLKITHRERKLWSKAAV